MGRGVIGPKGASVRDDRFETEGRWGRLKTFAGVVAVAFAITLALVIGNRLTAEALGVLAGAVCGVGAAIPTTLIVVAVTRRRDGVESSREGWTPRQMSERQAYPPVIVVSPQGLQPRGHQGWNELPASLSVPMERDFTVVGGMSTDGEEV